MLGNRRLELQPFHMLHGAWLYPNFATGEADVVSRVPRWGG